MSRSDLSDFVCRPTEYKSVNEFLNRKQFMLSTIIGDGFCLLRAVEGGLKQHNGISLKEIILKIRSEFADNMSYYLPFCLANRNASKDLQKYLDHGIFDQGMADIGVAALCNGLKVRLLIYEVSKSGNVTETVHPPGRVSPQFTVCLLRSGSGTDGRTSSEHYDLLLPSSTDNFTTTQLRKACRPPPVTVTIPDMFRNHKKQKLAEGIPIATADVQSAPVAETDVGDNDLHPPAKPTE
jgi:hypothetical protein